MSKDMQSIEDDVRATMSAHFAARIKGDARTVRDSYSEQWTDSKGFSKNLITDSHLIFTDAALQAGVDIDLDSAGIHTEGGDAVVGPVCITTIKGSITHEYKLRKESDDVWRLLYTKTLDWDIPMNEASRKIKPKIDASAQANRLHREHLLSDSTRPSYHFVTPEGVAFPFDPNGAIFWQGRYHLFYIFQDKSSGVKSDHWGHVSSTDLFHWRYHPTGLLEGMYSGNCFINESGIPTMCYHQVNQGNALAVAVDDDLNEWTKLPSNPITPVTEVGDEHHGKYRSWDPFGWYDDGTYYAIFGGSTPAVAKSDNLHGPWTYVGDLFAHGLDGVSLQEDVSCAELFKLGDKDVLLCISHRMGCRYYVGCWKDEQFYPESHGQMSWVDNMFFAPESLQDDQGRRIMWAWLLDSDDFFSRIENGWSGTMSLPRVLSLGDDGALNMDVPDEIKALRYRPFTVKNLLVEPGQDMLIGGIRGNSFEMIIEMESADATECGVKVCVSADGEEQTSISYLASEGQLQIDTRKSGPEKTPKGIESGPFRLKEQEPLRLRIFVDRSVVEVFANSRQAIMRRIYPSQPDSLGVSVFSKGGVTKIPLIKSWCISPSNPY